MTGEIYSKSTICDFLLMVNSNRDHITNRLQDIFAYLVYFYEGVRGFAIMILGVERKKIQVRDRSP